MNIEISDGSKQTEKYILRAVIFHIALPGLPPPFTISKSGTYSSFLIYSLRNLPIFIGR